MAWREHNDDHSQCWCTKTFPVDFQGKQVGVATPLEDGNYSIQLTAEGYEGSVLQGLLDQGIFNQFSIQEPIQDVLFELEEDEND